MTLTFVRKFHISHLLYLFCLLTNSITTSAAGSYEVINQLTSANTQAVNELRAPEVQLLDVTIESIDFTSAWLAIFLNVKNPNPSAIVVEEVRYQLNLKKIPVKRGVIRQRELFPAHSSREVKVPVSLNYDEHFSSIMAALTSSSPAVYEILGDIQIQGQKESFKFSHQGRWSFSQPASLTMNKTPFTETEIYQASKKQQY